MMPGKLKNSRRSRANGPWVNGKPWVEGSIPLNLDWSSMASNSLGLAHRHGRDRPSGAPIEANRLHAFR